MEEAVSPVIIDKLASVNSSSIETPSTQSGHVNKPTLMSSRKNNNTTGNHLPVGHSVSLPIHSRILSGDFKFISDAGFWMRSLVVASFAAVTAMIFLLISAFGPRRRFQGYQVANFKDRDFVSVNMDDEDDEEISIFDATDHKHQLLSKSRHT